MSRRAAAALALTLTAACSRGESDAKLRLLAGEDRAGPALGSFDFDHPAAALALDADEVARRLGSFQWSATVDWTVERGGDDARRVHAAERHRVRQAAGGDFEVVAEIDPGSGPGALTGKEIVFVGGRTFARAKHAPFRERPTDRGRDARRYRDESFEAAGALARLYGNALAITPSGEATVLGHRARRYRLALAPGAAAPAPAPRPGGLPPPDDDSARHFAFLEKRVPAAADGELLLDAATGAPLRVHLTGAFTVKDAPGVRASFELLAQVKALGADGTIVAPRNALPDERKPAGVANALDAAGLRKRGEEGKQAEEPADDAGE